VLRHPLRRGQGQFDDRGFPLADEGASSVVPGLYSCGVHFLRCRKSSLLFGVGEDAAIVADQIAISDGR
jgi:putative flavoprotein involved in K+ transport